LGLGAFLVCQPLSDKKEQSQQKEVAILISKDFPILSSWHIVSLMGKKLSPIATIFKKHLSEQAKGWI
jgi:hypothetical protein